MGKQVADLLECQDNNGRIDLYAGPCISSRKVGRTVRVWGDYNATTVSKYVEVVWKH